MKQQLSILLLLFLLSSCVREDTVGCVQYTLNVKVVDANGNDLTQTGAVEKSDVYLFDENGFVRMVPSGVSSDYYFGYSKSKRLTLVAWGNAKADTLITTALAVGTSIEEAKIQLRRHASGTHIPVTDLFYSRVELMDGTQPSTRGVQESIITLVMQRLTAGLSIRTRYFAERYPYNFTPYRFIVRGTGTEVDFTGSTTGEDAGYEPASITSSSGDVYAPLFHVFPMLDDGRIEIDIYRGEEHICTIAKDNSFNPLRITAGMQTNIEIDFRYTTVKTFVTVTDWGEEVNQDTEM